MTIAASSGRRGDGRLWAIALGLSLLLNLAILALAGFASLKSEEFRQSHPVSPPPAAESTVLIFPDVAASLSTPEPLPARPAKPSFSRTSEDQAAPPPENPAFIGERDTQATSDRTPDPTAPLLPAQAGIQPKSGDDLETTESRYQDGSLAGNPSAKAQQESQPVTPTPPAPMPDPTLADTTTPGEQQQAPGTDDSKSAPPPREELFEGPNPFDVPVPPDAPKTTERPAHTPSPTR